MAVGGTDAHAMFGGAGASRAADLVVLDGQHASLARGDELARVEREGDERRTAADEGTLVGGADRTRSVFDECDPAFGAQRFECIDVGRHAALVDDDDRLGRWGEHRLNGLDRRFPVATSMSQKTGVAPT